MSFILSFFPAYSALCHLFLLITYFLAGIPALISSIEDLCALRINIDVLMTVAAFLSVLIGSASEGALLLVLFSFSGALEDAVSHKARSAITSLKKLSPTIACVIQSDGTLIERAIHDIAVGTQILVKAGQIVPLDGKIIHGRSSLNLSHLTGESLPIAKKTGDSVTAGGRNLDGALTVEITHTVYDSTLAKIIQLVTTAQEAKPKFQRWLDKVGDRYALCIMSLSCLFAIFFPLFFSIPYLGSEGSIYRALSFLITASPCALIIAVPIAYLSSISCCAKKGILLKGGLTLDALAKCTTIAFDKTGTLTKGELVCLNVIPVNPLDKASIDEAVVLAAALERNAIHPIAKAILAHAQEKKLPIPNLDSFKAVSGYGLEGTFENKKLFIGNPEYIYPLIDSREQEAIHRLITLVENRGDQYSILLIEAKLFLFTFRDALRPHIKEQLSSLRRECGLKLIMLTGDHYKSAQIIANEIGIDEFHADLRPEDKLAHIEKLSQATSLAMVGDGSNDAPALARATIGISMGKMGSETAIDASDIVLLKDNLEMLTWLVKKARATVRIVKQNLTLAFAVILIAITPALFGFIPLWLAVIIHEGGTVLVGLNALRLLKK